MSSAVASKDTSKLTLAAEELIKAACCHVESTSLAFGQETVESLKKLLLSSSDIEKSVKSLDASVNSNLKVLNQSISDLKEVVVSLKSITALQAKDISLQWAISNAGLNCFKMYRKDPSSYNAVDSTELVREILFSFRTGRGRYINGFSMITYSQYSNTSQQEEGEKQFRDKISQQIHELLGQKPRIDVVDKSYAIYYS
jgi:hypothetical protein